jgi:acyl transferase domain-containing protein
VGDPIECESIRRTFGGGHRSQDVFLGSVKDNIGHAEAASGAAALLKAILMMQNRVIPKQANFTLLNPKIPPLERDRLAIAKQSQPWTATKLAAAINNYGAAGSNAVLVLQENPMSSGKKVDIGTSTPGQEFPLFVSARSPESLRSYCAALKLFISKPQGANASEALANVAYNLASKQNRTFEYSWISTAPNLTALSSQLESAAAGFNNFRKTPQNVRPVVFCFSGQTGKTVSLSEDLFNSCKLLQTHLVRYCLLLFTVQWPF